MIDAADTPSPEETPWAQKGCHRSWSTLSQVMPPDPAVLSKPSVVGGKVVMEPERSQIVHGVAMSPCIGPACHLWDPDSDQCAETAAFRADIQLKRAQLAALEVPSGDA